MVQRLLQLQSSVENGFPNFLHSFNSVSWIAKKIQGKIRLVGNWTIQSECKPVVPRKEDRKYDEDVLNKSRGISVSNAGSNVVKFVILTPRLRTIEKTFYRWRMNVFLESILRFGSIDTNRELKWRE